MSPKSLFPPTVSPGSSESNPFSSRYVRPGAVPFFFPQGGSLQELIHRLQQTGWRGQILGAHGSGKSALLAELIPAIQKTGRRTALYELHQGCRSLPAPLPPPSETDQPLVVLVDGYEQLSRWHRFRLRRQCRQSGFGLIVTSHRSVGLPDLIHLRPIVDLAQRIVQWLLRGSSLTITPEETAAAYHAHHGNLREMLFALYDLWEQRFRGG